MADVHTGHDRQVCTVSTEGNTRQPVLGVQEQVACIITRSKTVQYTLSSSIFSQRASESLHDNDAKLSSIGGVGGCAESYPPVGWEIFRDR